MISFLSQLSWRFATKRFDTSKSVSEADLGQVLEAIRLAPTSLGLQPFHVYVVESQTMKEKLHPAARNQMQIIEAKYVLVFCARLDIVQRVDDYINESTKQHPELVGTMETFRQYRKGLFPASRSAEDVLAWASKSTYIALGFGLAACAELKVDSCPMEGFDKDKVAEVLQTPSHLKPVVCLAIGYRSQEPDRPKFRFPKEEVFSFV